MLLVIVVVIVCDRVIEEKLKKMWPSMYSLADACVSYDPDHRPTIAEVLTSLRRIASVTKFERL